MTDYREKVQAEKVCWKNWPAVRELMGDEEPKFRQESGDERIDDCGEGPFFLTLRKPMTVPRPEQYGGGVRLVDLVVRHGEYLIKRSDGSFAVATPEGFAQSFESAPKPGVE